MAQVKNHLDRYRVSHKRRPIAQILKADISIILPSLTSLSTSGIFLIFEKRASFLGNPVPVQPIPPAILKHL